jgi:hypothetical protein
LKNVVYFSANDVLQQQNYKQFDPVDLLDAALHILQGIVSLQQGELPNAENELKVSRMKF